MRPSHTFPGRGSCSLFLRSMGVTAILASCIASAHATDYYWDADGDSSATLGGSGIWDTFSSVWRQGSDTGVVTPWPVFGANNDALLQGTPGTLTLTAPILVNDILVNPAGGGIYIIEGQSLQLNGAKPSVIDVASGATFQASAAGAFWIADAGLVKSGLGTLGITGTYNISGDILLNAGTTTTGVSTFRSDRVTIAAGATLTKANVNTTLGALSGAGLFSTGSGTILQTALVNGIFSGSIATSGAYTLRGANGTTQTLNGDVTGMTSTKTIGTHAGLTLSGTGDSISGVVGGGSIILRDGTLTLDNSAGNTTAPGGRIPDASSLDIRGGGGTVTLIGSTSGSVETFGTLTAQSGPVTLSVTHNGGAGGTELRFANAVNITSQTTSTYNFTGTGGTLGTAGANPRVIFATVPNRNTTNGMLAKTNGTASVDTGWALVNGSSWAGYDTVNGIIALPEAMRDSATLSSASDLELVDFRPSATVTTLSANLGSAPATPLGALKISPTATGQSMDIGSFNLHATALMLKGSTDFTITATTGAIANGSNRYIWVTDPNATLTYSGQFTGANEIIKAGPGILSVTNASPGFPVNTSTDIQNGVLRAPIAAFTASTGSNGARFIFRGTGVMEISGGGTFMPTLGNANVVGGTVNFGSSADNTLGNGGFSAFGGDATVTMLIGGLEAAPVWNGTDFIRDGYALTFGSTKSDSLLTLTNSFSLNNAAGSPYVAREIRVTDNPNSTADATRLSGSISGVVRETDLLKTGDGTLQLTGISFYVGNTLVHQGVLQIGATGGSAGAGDGLLASTEKVIVDAGATLRLGGTLASFDRINDLTSIILNGGTFNTGALQEGDATTVGLGPLTLTASSVLDFTGTGGLLHFADSSASAWSSITTDFTLSIYNWTSGAGGDSLRFGMDNLALTQAQLDHIRFFSGEGTGFLGTGAWTGVGGQVIAVPEPSVVGAVLAGAASLASWRRFRHRRTT